MPANLKLPAWLDRELQWLWASLCCAVLYYGMNQIEALKAAGGWKALVAAALTVVGKRAYEAGKNYVNNRMGWT